MDTSSFISEIGLFALKLLIVVVGVMLMAGAIAAAARGAPRTGPRLDAVRLDKRWREHKRALLQASGRMRALRQSRKDERRRTDKRATPRARVFVCRFDGNLQASGTPALAEQVNALLQVAEPADEIVLRLKSPGGLVHAYGHATSQLERLRSAGLRLTVAVDEVAASGGYLMASVADQIIAAPFAVLGSIGVVAQIPNLHRFLKRRDIDVELHTAGRWKRTLTLLGENTDEARAKFRADLERTHVLFKNAVARYRPALDIERIATGETWYGSEALEVGLIDRVATSDAYLLERSRDADIIALRIAERKSLADRLAGGIARAAARVSGRVFRRTLNRAAAPAAHEHTHLL
jgi:serine protease SohB